MLEYRAPPTLNAFLADDSFARCVVGPFGSGKSSACAMELLRRAQGQARGRDGLRHTRFAVVRNTRPQLRDTTRKTVDQWLGSFGTWREEPMEFRVRAGDVDCEVLFRALDRPEDVKNLLSLELTGCYFNELREISQAIFAGMTGRVGRYPAKVDGGPTWWGIWADTNPWHRGHWASKLFTSKLRGYGFWRQPSGLSKKAENVDNLPPGYYERLSIGKDEEWIRVYVHGEDGSADQGSIFGRWLERLEQSGRLGAFAHGADNVFTSWDLGLADATAVWFWRIRSTGVEVLDWLEDQGKGLEWYFEEVDRRAKDLGWKYLRHWLPHDAAQKTLASGVSVRNRFNEKYGAGAVSIGPDLTKVDRINAGRWLLEQPGTRFHERARPGFEMLREFRFEWDEEGRCFSRQPLHNFASHTGDAWTYVAAVVRATELITRKPTPKEPNVGPVMREDGKLSVTMDQLWEMHDR